MTLLLSAPLIHLLWVDSNVFTRNAPPFQYYQKNLAIASKPYTVNYTCSFYISASSMKANSKTFFSVWIARTWDFHLQDIFSSADVSMVQIETLGLSHALDKSVDHSDHIWLDMFICLLILESMLSSFDGSTPWIHKVTQLIATYKL